MSCVERRATAFFWVNYLIRISAGFTCALESSLRRGLAARARAAWLSGDRTYDFELVSEVLQPFSSL